MTGDFGQVLTAMVTPFKDDGPVNYDVAQELALHLIENGSDGLVVSGTTGESPTLSTDEKLSLYKAVKEAVGGRARVIAGTGNNCTRESAELTEKATAVGVDGCMLVVPYYNKPPQEGLYEHFKVVAQHTPLPVILYNVPSRTACNLDAKTVIALSEVENIMAVKEASGNFAQVSEIISGTPADFLVYSGQDEWNLPMLALGTHGVISVASHVVGEELQDMFTSYKAGDQARAREVHARLLPLFKALFMTTNPIMVKAAVRLKGIDVGKPRPPLVDANETQINALRSLLVDLRVAVA